MATYRLDDLLPPAPLTGYTTALRGVAQAHAAALAVIPTIASDLQALEDGTAELIRADLAWEVQITAADAALSERDFAFGEAMKPYERVRGWLPTIIRKEEKSSVLQGVLDRCDSPSALKATDAPAALERLASAIDGYPSLFAKTSVGPADAALLRAHKAALVAASEALSQAGIACDLASGHRNLARSALVVSARLIEDYLRREGGDEALAAIRKIRIQHLPRKAKATAKPEEPTPAS